MVTFEYATAAGLLNLFLVPNLQLRMPALTLQRLIPFH